MKIGVTATREGLTKQQKSACEELLLSWLVSSRKAESVSLSHGDCVGGDYDIHQLVVRHKKLRKRVDISIFPPSDNKMRAFLSVHGNGYIFAPLPYLERNKSIVRYSNCLLACPKDYQEELRSGTWSTVRFARYMQREIFVVYPDGSVVQPSLATM